MSQEQVGIEAELDPMSARVRMNRYENSRRIPNPELVARFATVLGVPTPYFYCDDDDEARLLIVFHGLSAAKKKRALDYLATLAG